MAGRKEEWVAAGGWEKFIFSDGHESFLGTGSLSNRVAGKAH